MAKVSSHLSTAIVGTGKQTLWMKEVRRLTESGHQTSIISTAYDMQLGGLAARMFSRWSQENFFRYMMRHYAIDVQTEHDIKPIPETEIVVNPKWRGLESQRNSIQNKLRYRHSRFGQLTLHEVSAEDKKKYERWLEKRSQLLEEIEQYENQLAQLKKELKETPKHISLSDLGEEDQFHQLAPDRKRLVDTIKMIAYRSETAMAHLMKDDIVDLPEARTMLQDLFVSSADILPNPESQELVVRVHGASRPAVNRRLSELMKHLNSTDITYPGTQMKVRYELNSSVLLDEENEEDFGANTVSCR